MKFSGISKLLTIVVLTTLAFTTYSCSTSKEAAETASNDGLDDLSFTVEKSGAVLWGETCGNCHNAPDPTAFSDREWDAIGSHMRIRAGLTAEETKKIVTFLQQSN
jgi:hypothetical protein